PVEATAPGPLLPRAARRSGGVRSPRHGPAPGPVARAARAVARDPRSPSRRDDRPVPAPADGVRPEAFRGALDSGDRRSDRAGPRDDQVAPVPGGPEDAGASRRSAEEGVTMTDQKIREHGDHLTDAELFAAALPAGGRPEALPAHLSECL